MSTEKQIKALHENAEANKQARLHEQQMNQKIEGWKKTHGKVFLFEVNSLHFYFRKPDMKVMSAVNNVAAKSEVKAQQVFFKNCLLNKDMGSYAEDVDIMMSLAPHLEGLIKSYTVKVKEL
jgi:hypothetical protein